MTRDQVLAVIKSARWNIQGFNAYPLLIMAAGNESAWSVADALGVGYRHIFYFFRNGRAQMHYDEGDWQRIGEAYYERIRDMSGLRKLIDASIEDFREHSAASAREAADSLSLERAAERAQKYLLQLRHAIGGSMHAIEGLTFVGESRLRNILTQKGAFDEMTFSRLCSPTEPSFLAEAQLELWKIKTAPASKQLSMARDFLIQYPWIENTFLGSAKLTPEKVLHRAEELLEAPSQSEFAAIRSEKEAIMEKLSFTPEERFIVETVDKCFKWQDDRKRQMFETIELLSPVLERIKVLTGIDIVTLQYAHWDEITVGNLRSDVFQDLLAQRREGVAEYCTPVHIETLIGEDYTYLVAQLHAAIDETITEFKGMAASRGIVQGIVRVCESVSDIARVQRGEVLVASMTRPEYLPAMQRAAAFITDEGGITSHAAIISRELKKPCIIGTKIATKILKDGDLVEVDADHGIVRMVSPISSGIAKTVE
ncbi:MAG TPA: PEP-utilizing enzyme [Candidatus Paceibacterota bacterium]|jgi:phosphohistidine swiveling domain-containing protein|nr:PEP-utilizing enzyme [Candidatus Paceibacterota bacterium]